MKGEEVKQKLKNAGFELAEIADKIGISPQLLQMWLSVNEVKISKLQTLAAAINKNIDFFYSNVSILDSPPVQNFGSINECQECKAKDILIEELRSRIKDKETIISLLSKDCDDINKSAI